MKPVVAQGHNCVTVNGTGCGFYCHSGKRNIFFFHFFRSGIEAKRGHSTGNATGMRRKVEKGVS